MNNGRRIFTAALGTYLLTDPLGLIQRITDCETIFASPSPAAQFRDNTANLKPDYTMPDNVRKFDAKNIGDVVNALSSGKTVSEPGYVQLLANFVQFLYQSLEGKTYNSQVRARHNIHDNIEIYMSRELYTPSGRKMESGERQNKLFFINSLSPAQFMDQLIINLTNTANAPNPLLSFAQVHRMFSYAVAKFPELIVDEDKNFILNYLIQSYSVRLIGTGSEKETTVRTATLPYLTLFAAKQLRNLGINDSYLAQSGIENIDTGNLDEVAQFLRQHPSVTLRLKLDIWSMILHESNRNNFLKSAAAGFIDSTEKYVSKENPNMPANKKIKLKSNFDRFRKELEQL